MGKFDQFNYWRNGVKLTKTPIKKVPHDGTEKLVYYKIKNGEYDHSPFWEMSNNELQKLDDEVIIWRASNSRASEQSFEDWFINRRKVYNKKIEKMREAHQQYEEKTLRSLIVQMEHDFNCNNITSFIEGFEGTLEELYFAIKKLY